MDDKARRKQLQDDYKQTAIQAGVYRIVNTRTGRVLLGSTTNLPSLHSKLAFARTTNSASALDLRLKPDVQAYGIEAFELEVLETLDPKPEQTPQQVQDDLRPLGGVAVDAPVLVRDDEGELAVNPDHVVQGAPVPDELQPWANASTARGSAHAARNERTKGRMTRERTPGRGDAAPSGSYRKGTGCGEPSSR